MFMKALKKLFKAKLATLRPFANATLGNHPYQEAPLQMQACVIYWDIEHINMSVVGFVLTNWKGKN